MSKRSTEREFLKELQSGATSLSFNCRDMRDGV